MTKHVCGVVERTFGNSSMQLRLKIEVFFGLEKILNFDNVSQDLDLKVLAVYDVVRYDSLTITS